MKARLKVFRSNTRNGIYYHFRKTMYFVALLMNSTQTASNFNSTTAASSEIKELLNLWPWKFYVLTFAILNVIFAFSCLIVLVQQRENHSRRNIYGRFTTAQLFIAAVLKAAVLLWRPLLINETSMAVLGGALLLYSFSLAFSLSAYCILLLILLETTRITLASPRLQNIWVLLAITAVFTIIVATFDLLVLFRDQYREYWSFISDMTIYVWGMSICVGYAVAGFRMCRNLRSSLQMENFQGQGRLKNIIISVFLSSVITAVLLTLVFCASASDFGAIRGLQLKKDSFWIRLIVLCLLRSCEFANMLMIFAIVIKSSLERNRINDVPSVQMGTQSSIEVVV